MDPVDLTHRVESGMPVYPGDPAVSLEPHATMDADGYRVTRLSLGTHAGTHVDAPAHTEPDGATLDEFAVEEFRFDATFVDLAGLDAREPITPEMLPEGVDDVEAGTGVDGAADGLDTDLLVIRTGWGEYWGDQRYLDHPYLTPAAARRIAAAGCSVGLDTLNPDPTPTDRAGTDEPDGVPAHRELLGSGNFVFENLRLSTGLPEQFVVRAYPLRVDADGAPVRAVAASE